MFKTEGWVGCRFIDASEAHGIRGLEEIASRVAFGGMPGNTPVFVGTHEADGGYPGVVIGLPVDAETVEAVRHGDAATARDLLEMLQEAYDLFLDEVKRGERG